MAFNQNTKLKSNLYIVYILTLPSTPTFLYVKLCISSFNITNKYLLPLILFVKFVYSYGNDINVRDPHIWFQFKGLFFL